MHATVGLALLLAVLFAPTTARGEDRDVTPILRVALGPAFHFSPPPGRAVSQFAMDITAGAGIGGDPEKTSFRFMPELGYSYDHLGVHLFSASAGVGFGNMWFSALYHPRFLLGGSGAFTAVGLRNSLGLHMLSDTYSVEVGVQDVFAGGLSQHDFRVMLGMNPLGAARFVPAVAALVGMFGLLTR